MKVVGPMLDVENPNKFVFLRSFLSLAERDRMKDAFYSGELWRNELEGLATPLLDTHDVISARRHRVAFSTGNRMCDAWRPER